MKTREAASADGYGSTPYRTRQWECPGCGNWNYEHAGLRGGQAWHDCENCDYSERSPSDFNRRQAPEGWNEQDQGVYDYNEGWVPMGSETGTDADYIRQQEEAYRRRQQTGAFSLNDHECEDCHGEGCPGCGGTGKTSKYQVVALGELQQPGAVGATQTTGLVEADGVPSNPGDKMTDAGKNSFEENVALETWVNLAVDMLNRGEQQDQVLAKLAHDGCPDPKGVLQMAVQQPEKQETPEEGTADPFENQGGDPMEQTQPSSESVHHQPPVMASIEDPRRISLANDIFDPAPKKKPDQESWLFDVAPGDTDNTEVLFTIEHPNREGEEPDYQDPEGSNGEQSVQYSPKKYPKGARAHVITPRGPGMVLSHTADLWGQNWMKVALDDGQVHRFDPSQVQLEDTRKSPVEDIQAFIDSMPAVEPTRPGIFARLDNLNGVRRMIHAAVSKCSYEEQTQLVEWDKTAEAESRDLREILSHYQSPADVEYTKLQPRFFVPVGRVMDPAFNARIAEKAVIFVSELPAEVKADRDQTRYAAVQYAEGNNGDVLAFVTAVEKCAKYQEDAEAIEHRRQLIRDEDDKRKGAPTPPLGKDEFPWAEEDEEGDKP